MSTVIGLDMGSSSYGVSAYSGSLKLTLRAEFSEEFSMLLDYIKKKAFSLADKYGLETEITEHEMFPSTENHISCVDKISKAAEKCGYKTLCPEEPFRWSEDFGRYLKETEGAIFGIGSGKEHPQLHTENYEFPDDIIPAALDMFKELIG